MVERLMQGERVNLNPPSRASLFKTALEINRSDFLPGCQEVGAFIQKMVGKGLDPIGVEVEVTEARAERAGLPAGLYKIDSLIEDFMNDNPRSPNNGQWQKVVCLKPNIEDPMRKKYLIDPDNNSFSFFGL